MSSSEIKVHSAEQAVEMAKASYGRPTEGLQLRVEEEQDYWIVRIGPDAQGETLSYLISIWDERAGPLMFEVRVQANLSR